MTQRDKRVINLTISCYVRDVTSSNCCCFVVLVSCDRLKRKISMKITSEILEQIKVRIKINYFY